MSVTKVHLDTDFGGDIDDICALAMLLKWPDVDVVGVTTVAEDRGRRAGYARYALRLAGRDDIPVAAGADGALHGFRSPVVFPEEADFWPDPVSPSPNPLPDALALMRRNIENGALVVAIGPYTNLALLDRQSPGLLRKTPVYLMGGHVRPARSGFPRWDHTEDWNVQEDASSARYVYEHLDPTIVPLEMTAETSLRRSSLPALDASGPLARLIARQARAHAVTELIEERYGRTCTGLPDDIINFQHDPLACAVALKWDGVIVEELHLRIELRDGLLVEREDPAGQSWRVVTGVDGPRFDALWLDLVCR